MTKTKRERKIAELQAKIREATLKWDYVSATKYKKELAKIKQSEDDDNRRKLSEHMSNFAPDAKLEATLRLISVVVHGDILSNAIGDFKMYMRDKFGVYDISIIEDMEKAFKILQNAVASIDRVGKDFFSENYMNIVDELETMYGATLRNTALNKLLKSARSGSKKGI